MNSLLASCIEQTCPKFNKDITEGFSKEVLKEGPAFLDRIFRDSIQSLNKNVPLVYTGYSFPSPKDEFKRMFANNDNRVNYDLARSDIFMVDFHFEFEGKPFIKSLYLPFSDRGNMINISNTTYHIVPVLSDTVISPSSREVFVRLLRDKNSFKSITRNVIYNGERMPVEVIYSYIIRINEAQITDNIGKPLPAVSLFVLSEYGLRETFKKYLGSDDIIVAMGNVDEYREHYNVYESTRVKPKSLKEFSYIGHDLKICVSKNIEKTLLLDNLISGIIYSLDMLPEQAPDLVSLFNNKEVTLRQEQMYWRILLGRLAYKNSYTVTRIIADIDEVYNNLKGYMDTLTKKTLASVGYDINTYFDLLVLILKNYNIWLLDYKEYNSNIKNRYVDIRYYIYNDLIIGFNKVILNIGKRGLKQKGLSLKEINKIMMLELSLKKIFSLVKSKSVNLCMAMAESTSDIMYPKMTALLEDRLWSLLI